MAYNFSPVAIVSHPFSPGNFAVTVEVKAGSVKGTAYLLSITLDGEAEFAVNVKPKPIMSFRTAGDAWELASRITHIEFLE